MNKTRRNIALALSTALILGSSLTVFAEEKPVTISEPVEIDVEVEEENFEFINFNGIVKDIEEDGGNLRVLLAKEDESEALTLNIDENVLIVDSKDENIVTMEDIKVNTEVSVKYHKTTPVGFSLPAYLTPDVLVIESGENSVFVEHFNENLISADNELKLNAFDNTNIFDTNNEVLSLDDISGRDLVVFYNIIMPSIPAQTNPSTIIVLPLREEIKNDENMENEIIVEIILEDELITLEDGTNMIPLREVAETLGFEVTWNGKTRSVELLRGNNWSTLTLGKNAYSFAKMHIELESSPILVDSKTYVPASFVEKVLQGELVYEENGRLRIIK